MHTQHRGYCYLQANFLYDKFENYVIRITAISPRDKWVTHSSYIKLFPDNSIDVFYVSSSEIDLEQSKIHDKMYPNKFRILHLDMSWVFAFWFQIEKMGFIFL